MMLFKTCLKALFALLLVMCPLFGDVGHQELLFDSLCLLHLEEGEHLHVEPLYGGVTNSAYKITGKNVYFAKFSLDKDCLVGASLQHEFEILNKIASLHIAPKPILFDQENNFLITEFVIGYEKNVNLRDQKTLEQCCRLLKRLHVSDVEFTSVFCPFEQLEILLKNARDVESFIPQFLVTFVEEVIKQWKRDDLLSLSTPCHLDLHSKNLIQNDQLWMIDWEYAAQSSPWYDLAVVASGEKFSDTEMDNLLQVYTENSYPSDQLRTILWKMRILADARWALWSCIQDKISPLEYSFSELRDYYTSECEKRLFEFNKV